MYQVSRDTIHHTTIIPAVQGSTRSASRTALKLPNARTTRYGLESISYQATKLYNEAPASVTTASYFSRFKQNLYQWLKDKLVNDTTRYI